MKVVLVNGSPNANGCTFTGLSVIKEQLASQGVDSEIYQVGKRPVSGCIACRACKQPGKMGKRLRTLANNMAYLIKCKIRSNIEPPDDLPAASTNFIR